MLLDHPHAIVGEVARRQRICLKREACAIAIFRYWSSEGVPVSVNTLAELTGLPRRTSRRLVGRLVQRGVIARAGAGYLLLQREVAA
jgi:DNA-binding IclR family transcriptional regulator